MLYNKIYNLQHTFIILDHDALFFNKKNMFFLLKSVGAGLREAVIYANDIPPLHNSFAIASALFAFAWQGGKKETLDPDTKTRTQRE